MSNIEIEYTCPLGSKCEEIKDNKIYRCAWYTEIKGTDGQGNEVDDWKCAMSWQPILQVEISGTNRGQTAAIESFRNESVKHSELLNNTLNNTIEKSIHSSLPRLIS